jgi:hypothetical protein
MAVLVRREKGEPGGPPRRLLEDRSGCWPSPRERPAPGVGPPGRIKMECMVGQFDLWDGPQSLRNVVAALEIAYQSTMARMLP